MMDQAEKLRRKIEQLKNGSHPSKAIAVVSGKGGVGKSNFSLNFALGLSKAGSNVLLFDMDIGMGNIDILMGVTPTHNIVNVFENGMPLKDIIEKGPQNLSYIAAGTGLSTLFTLNDSKLDTFLNQFEDLLTEYNYIIFDMGAGISKESLNFIMAVHDIFVITTPEPTSITDAYAMMKYIHLKASELPFYILVNKAFSEKQALSTFNRLSKTMKHFLDKDIALLGDLPDNNIVRKAVSQQVPFSIYAPDSNVSRSMDKIVTRYLKNNLNQNGITSSYSFIARLKQYLLER
ncbi:MinD/ParA family protein [Bacillus sp. Marseille-P3661]|uniref:MinD/ParA family protein n=1 Tax=Bacillus sp. Marseille-P3661 TaxID=1936234 RepID=UPI000C822D37|nr:MinD/ParA family protein [Bacillus sp. Marseille-P3661]